MFTVVGWSESQDTAGVLSNVAAMVDQHVTTDGDDVLVPSFAPNLAGYFALGATISRAQISSPSLRKSTLLEIAPVNVSAEPAANVYFANRFAKPRPLTSGEGLRALVAEGAAGAEQETVLAWLQDEFTAAPDGEIQTVRATSATTVTAYAWSLCPLTLDQQLEAGRYAIVGMKAVSAGAIAARLVMAGYANRPGVIAHDSVGDISAPEFRYGGIGLFGEFEHTFVPQVEFLSISADTAETVYLDIVKVA